MSKKKIAAGSGPPEQQLENQLCFAVYAAGHAFTQAYKPFLEPQGLTYPQYLVLLQLWERDDQTVKQLGEPLFLDSGTLTPLLKRMEAAGWIMRRRDSDDERVVRVTLTDKGRAFREAAREIPAALMCAAGLDVPTLSALRNKLKRVTGGLRESRKIARDS
ncbi:MAG: MarR family transcriptional regulator [Pseudomonadota bacterium]